MSLVDTTDGTLMLGANDWVFVKPMRKLYYNQIVTAVSVVVPVMVGSIEALRLLGDEMRLKGAFWDGIGALIDNMNILGFAIIGLFIAAWAGSVVLYRYRGLDSIEVWSAKG